jgi:hypothetical protein
MNSIKCPGCGLVNFATATECKRCQMYFGSHSDSSAGHDANAGYQSYWPQKPEYDEKTQKVFSGGVVFLTGILIVGIAILLLQQVLHPFDPSTAKGLGGLVGLVGVLLMVLTHIWLLIRIFEQSVGWGLASVFVPLVGLIAVAQFWEKTKRSFVGQMVCVGILFVGIGIGL